MWVGERTDFCYKDVFSLVCAKHKQRKHEVGDKSKIVKILKETFNLLRMKSMSFVLEAENLYHSASLRMWLFDRPIFDCDDLCRSSDKEKYKDEIILIDSVTTFTLALFCKLCCICQKVESIEDLKNHRNKACEDFLLFRQYFGNDVIHFNNMFNVVEYHPHYKEVRNFFCNYNIAVVNFAYTAAYFSFATKFGDQASEFLLQIDNDYADDLKHSGNIAFKEKKYKSAVTFYSNALVHHPYSFYLFGNCAQAYLALNKSILAELYSRFAIVINPEWCKAYYRLTVALYNQNNIHRAHLSASFGLEQCSVSSCKDCASLRTYVESIQKECPHKSCLKTKLKLTCNGSTAANLVDPEDQNQTCPQLKQAHEKIEPNATSEKHEIKESNEIPLVGSTVVDPEKLIVETEKDIKDNGWKERPNSENSIELCASELRNVLLEGRSAVKVKNMTKAMSHFNKTLELLNNVPKLCERDEFDPVAIKFMCGYVCYKSNTLESMNRAITLFKEIENNGKSIAPVCYFLGLAFKKFHKFQTALTYFKTFSSMNEETFDFKVSDWLDEDSLKEFKYESIQASLKNEIANCECPPPPNGICRFKSCDFVAIYFSDLSFKKCICLHCQERCILYYHITCWKSIKDNFDKNDKAFLDGHCFTPDCDGLIIKIEIIGKDGLVEKEFASKSNCKPKKRYQQRQMSLENKERKGHEKKDDRTRTVSETDAEFVIKKKQSKENKLQQPRQSRKISNSFNNDDDLKLDSDMSTNVEGLQTKTDANEKTSIKDIVCYPCPDAVCRYKDCPLNREMYFTDPFCEIFICVRCQEKCTIPYHVSCWKSLKKSISKSDDDVLNCPCFTPDCHGAITKVDVIGRDGIQDKHFTYKDSYKPRKRIKQRKVKLEKKLEKNERKKQEVRTRLLSGNFEDWEDEPEPTTENTNSNELNAGYQIYNRSDVTFAEDIHLSSDDDNKFGFASGITKFQRNGSANEKECDYKQSRHRELRTQGKYSQNLCDFPNAYSVQYSNTRKFMSSNIPNDFGYSNEVETALNTHDQPEDSDEEELKTIINSHFVNFLQCHGFVNISDPVLFKEMCNLSKEAVDLIDKKGGFLSFFQDSAEFVILNNNFCLFNDVKDFYKSGIEDSPKQSTTRKDLENVRSIIDNHMNTKTVQQIARQNNDMLSYMDMSHSENSKNIDELSTASTSGNQVSNRIENDTIIYTNSQKYNSDAVYSDIEDEKSSSDDDLPYQGPSRNYFNSSYKLYESNGNLCSSQTTGSKNELNTHSIIDSGKKLQESSSARLRMAKDSKSSLSLYEYVADRSLVKTEEKSKTSVRQDLNFSMSQEGKSNGVIVDKRREAETNVKDIKQPKTIVSTLQRKLPVQKYEEYLKKKEKLCLENETLHTNIRSLVTAEEHEGQPQNEIEDELETEMKIPQTSEGLTNAELQILNMKKSEYTKDFKLRLSGVETNIQELRNGLQQMEYMYHMVHGNMTSLQDKLNEYIKDMYASYTNFIERISDQMKEVENGASLSQLTKLQTPTFPSVPTMDTIVNEMKAQQFSPTSMQQAFANGLQNNGQLPSVLFQNVFPNVGLQNFQKTMPCGLNQSFGDSDVPTVNGCSQRTSLSSQYVASVSKLPPDAMPVKDIFSNSATTTFNEKSPQRTRSTNSNASSTTRQKPLPLLSENQQSRYSVSSEISEDSAKSVRRTMKSSRESIASGSCLNYEDSSSTKSSSYASTKSVMSPTSNIQYIEESSAGSSSHNNVTAEVKMSIKRERLRAIYQKIIATLKQECPDAMDSEIISCIKQYKTTNGSRGSKIPFTTIIADIKKIIIYAKKTRTNVGDSETAISSLLTTEVAATVSEMKNEYLESKSVGYPQDIPSGPGSSAGKSSYYDDNASIGVKMSKKGDHLKAMYQKITATLKQEFPDAIDSEIVSCIKQYRTTNGMRGFFIPTATIIADVKKILLHTRKKKKTNIGNSETAISSLLANEVAATMSEMKDQNLTAEYKSFRHPQDTPNSPAKLASPIVNNMPSQNQLMQHSEYDAKVKLEARKDVLEEPDLNRSSPNSSNVYTSQESLRIITAPRINQPKLFTNKSLTSCSKRIYSSAPQPNARPVTAWATNPMPNEKFNWNPEFTEHCCSICLEDMAMVTSYRGECGHKFHVECIKKWFKKQSNCPICRVHLLLPEEFPKLC